MRQPPGRRRVLAVAVTASVSLVTLVLSAAVAAPATSAAVDGWLQTRWVSPGGVVTLKVDALPENVSRATFDVVVSRASHPTRVTVCAGPVITDQCRRTASSPVKSASFTTTVDLTDLDRLVTVHSSAGLVQVTLNLVGYVEAGRGATGPAPSGPSSPSQEESSQEPSTSSTTATAEEEETTPPAQGPGGGWPSKSNTGVPAGTQLRVVNGSGSTPPGTVWSGNTMTVVGNGTVLEALDIRGLVRVEGKNVTIKNCLITGRQVSSSTALLFVATSGSVAVSNTEIYAKEPSVFIDGVIGQNFTLERVNIHTVVDSVKIIGDNVTIRQSWLHSNLHYLNDPAQGGQATHDDNVQIQRGNNITLSQNTMESSHNAAIQVTQDMGAVGTLVVDNNLVSGGGCSFNLADKGKGPLSGTTLRSNRFTRTSTYNCAITISPESHGVVSLADNRWVTWDGTVWRPGDIVAVNRT